jgi:hypothetical protein
MLGTARFLENEIAKSDDFNYNNQKMIENLDTILSGAFGLTDFIFFGFDVAEISPASMNVSVAPGFGLTAEGLIQLQTSITPVPVSSADGSSQRIDTVEIRRIETTFDEQQRAFKDPVSQAVSYQDIDTKTRWEIEVSIVAGTPGSASAPAHTAGWLKIAEITVPAGATSITDTNIKNVSTTFYGSSVPGWTNEATATWSFGSLADFLVAFRLKHLSDGTYKNDSVQTQHLDWGTGGAQVKATDMPIGTPMTGSTPQSSTASVHTALEAISTFLAANPLVNTTRHRESIDVTGPVVFTYSGLGLDAATYAARVELIGTNTWYVRHAAIVAGPTSMTVYMYSDDPDGIVQGPPLGRWGDGGDWGDGSVYGDREEIIIDLWVTKEGA